MKFLSDDIKTKVTKELCKQFKVTYIDTDTQYVVFRHIVNSVEQVIAYVLPASFAVYLIKQDKELPVDIVGNIKKSCIDKVQTMELCPFMDDDESLKFVTKCVGLFLDCMGKKEIVGVDKDKVDKDKTGESKVDGRKIDKDVKIDKKDSGLDKKDTKPEKREKLKIFNKKKG